jgi:Zn-dependent peptidase ImmA (M78 family)
MVPASELLVGLSADEVRADVDVVNEADWRAERAANDFAASLLMPASMVKREFTRTSDVRTLASRFNVSPAAMSFRLSNLRLQT